MEIVLEWIDECLQDGSKPRDFAKRESGMPVHGLGSDFVVALMPRPKRLLIRLSAEVGCGRVISNAVSGIIILLKAYSKTHVRIRPHKES